MRTHRLLGLFILVVFPGSFGLTSSVPPVPSTSLEPVVSVTGASATEALRVVEALERFRRASLALPDVTISFVASHDACAGYLGLFEAGPPAEITICDDLEFIVTHELAHAWIHHHVDARVRQAYLHLRDLKTWSGADASWSERGSEDAAFVIQQVLWRTQPAPDNEL